MLHVVTLNYSLPLDDPGPKVFLNSLCDACRGEEKPTVTVMCGPGMSATHPVLDVRCLPLEGPLRNTPDAPGAEANNYVFSMSRLSDIGPEDWVLFADFRDVYFQGYPLANDILNDPNRLHVFTESEDYECTTGQADANWLHRMHRGAVPEYLKGKSIICHGVVAGRRDVFLSYYEGLASFLAKSEMFMGLDQSYLNTEAYANGSRFNVHGNDDGPVTNLHLQAPFFLPGSVIVVNRGKRLPPIVHQYDRWPTLASSVRRHWGGA